MKKNVFSGIAGFLLVFLFIVIFLSGSNRLDHEDKQLSAYDEICSILNIPPEPIPTYDPNATLDDLFYNWEEYLIERDIELDSELAEEWKEDRLLFEKERYKRYVDIQASKSGAQLALEKRLKYTTQECDVFVHSNFFTATVKELTSDEMRIVLSLMNNYKYRPDGYDISTYYNVLRLFYFSAPQVSLVPYITYYIVDGYMIILCKGVLQKDIDQYHDYYNESGFRTLGHGEEIDGMLVTKNGVVKYELDNLPEWVTHIMKDIETCERLYYVDDDNILHSEYNPEYHIPYTQLKDFPFIDS